MSAQKRLQWTGRSEPTAFGIMQKICKGKVLESEDGGEIKTEVSDGD